MAEGKISSNITRGTITAESGVTFSELSVIQNDKTVYIRGYATLTSPATQGVEAKLGTLSGVAHPKSTVRFLCGTAQSGPYNTYTAGYLVIGTGGIFSVKTNNSNQSVFTFCLSYSIL